ncbi:MAG: class I SAM-dependent methyltransferase [Firmicutes bacterium]|nr:class I SAM-dependent methyltransferase [Bacillota bacterium]
MSGYEPSPTEVRLTLLLGNTIVSPFYKHYIDSLDLKGNERVLDFGSGSGVCSKHLAARLLKAGGHLTCLDISRVWQDVIKKTLKRYPNVDYILGDITRLHIPAGSFDAILIHLVIHDIDVHERPEILCHLARVLVDGGKVFVCEPVGREGVSVDDLRGLMRQNGLEEIDSRITRVAMMTPTYRGVFRKTVR